MTRFLVAFGIIVLALPAPAAAYNRYEPFGSAVDVDLSVLEPDTSYEAEPLAELPEDPEPRTIEDLNPDMEVSSPENPFGLENERPITLSEETPPATQTPARRLLTKPIEMPAASPSVAAVPEAAPKTTEQQAAPPSASPPPPKAADIEWITPVAPLREPVMAQPPSKAPTGLSIQSYAEQKRQETPEIPATPEPAAPPLSPVPMPAPAAMIPEPPEARPAPPAAPEKPAEPATAAAPKKPAGEEKKETRIDYSKGLETAAPDPLQPMHPAPATEKTAVEKADARLLFEAGSTDLGPTEQDKLTDIVSQLNAHEQIRLQLRAYASEINGSTSGARRLSLSRALAVRAYLMDRGIRPTRVDVRALGTEVSEGPQDRVDVQLVN